HSIATQQKLLRVSLQLPQPPQPCYLLPRCPVPPCCASKVVFYPAALIQTDADGRRQTSDRPTTFTMPQPLPSKEASLFRTLVRNYDDKQY
ncbi:hypothetical protein BN1708_005521, partial [Verticillium longisporum]